VASESGTATDPPLSADEIRARGTLISNFHSNPFGKAALQRGFTDRTREIVRDAVARYPQPSSEDIAWARALCDQRVPTKEVKEFDKAVQLVRRGLVFVAPAAVLLWGMFGTISAFLFDGGMTLMLCGIRVRSRRGHLASRWRCAWRCIVAWLPFFIGYTAGAYLLSRGETSVGWTLTALTALVHSAVVALALM